jgi:hypothetical protein
VGTAHKHQHFGPIVVSCESADLRPLHDAIYVYGNEAKERLPLALPAVPRAEVIDELYAAAVLGQAPLHDGHWAKDTLKICLAILESSEKRSDIVLQCHARSEATGPARRQLPVTDVTAAAHPRIATKSPPPECFW